MAFRSSIFAEIKLKFVSQFLSRKRNVPNAKPTKSMFSKTAKSFDVGWMALNNCCQCCKCSPISVWWPERREEAGSQQDALLLV